VLAVVDGRANERWTALSGVDKLAPALAVAIRRSPIRQTAVRLREWDLSAADVILSSYPRSGSTWLRNMLTQLVLGADASREDSYALVPQVGEHRGTPQTLAGGGRLIKTHERYFPTYRHVIHIVRDPRDVARSCYIFEDAQGRGRFDWDSYVVEFAAGRLDGFGGWNRHSRSYLEAANRGKDVTIVRYEDLRADTAHVLTTVAKVCRLDVTETQIAQACAAHALDATKARAQDEKIDRGFLGRQFGGTAARDPGTDPTRRESLRDITGGDPIAHELGYVD
jgi:hypothetical protein